jgi:Mg/Co/Ni transporter MgtE
MKKMVARLNIEHFRHMLESETDETKRRMLLRLLDEEEANMKALTKAEEKEQAALVRPVSRSFR